MQDIAIEVGVQVLNENPGLDAEKTFRVSWETLQKRDKAQREETKRQMLQNKNAIGRTQQSTISKSQFAHRPEWMHFNDRMRNIPVSFEKDGDEEEEIAELEQANAWHRQLECV